LKFWKINKRRHFRLVVLETLKLYWYQHCVNLNPLYSEFRFNGQTNYLKRKQNETFQNKAFLYFHVDIHFRQGKVQKWCDQEVAKNNSELDNENTHIITSTNLYLPRYKLSFSVAVNPYIIKLEHLKNNNYLFTFTSCFLSKRALQ